MGRAVVDPAELRRFARDLHKFNQELESLTAGLRARMSQLESTWRDQEQRKFAEQFQQTMRAFAKFNEASQQHEQFLLSKAGHVEAYLNQR